MARGLEVHRLKRDLQPVTRDYTFKLASRVRNIQYKKRAARAIREIKKFVVREMGTTDVRIDPKLNGYVWSKGIRFLPRRVRLRLRRDRTDDENAPEPTFVVCYHVPVDSFHGLHNETVDE